MRNLCESSTYRKILNLSLLKDLPCIGAEKIVLWVYIIQISIIEIIININSDNWLKFNLLF